MCIYIDIYIYINRERERERERERDRPREDLDEVLDVHLLRGRGQDVV